MNSFVQVVMGELTGFRGKLMAKIRIYELARELNIGNKELLDKLSNIGGIEAKDMTHMTSLNAETVKRMKDAFLGKDTDVVEEVRVRSTVIRRRKKTAKPKPVPEADRTEKLIEPEEFGPVAAFDEKKQTERASKTIQDQSIYEEKTDRQPQPETEVKKVEKVRPKSKNTKKRKKKETPAKIIKSAIQAPLPEEKPVSKEKSEVKVISDSKEKPVSEEKPEVQAIPDSKEKPVSKEKPGVEAIPASKGKPVSKKEQVTKKRRFSKEKPATIVSLGSKEKPISKQNSGKRKPAEDQVREKEKTKGKNKIREDKFKDKKYAKKKGSVHKRSVVERKDLYDRKTRGAKVRKTAAKTKQKKEIKKTQITVSKAIKRRVKIDDTIVLSDLAKRLGIKAGEMIKKLMDTGVMVTVNETIDFDTASLIAAEFNYELERASFEEEIVLNIQKEDPAKMKQRPPVVTIMGHVDHGKTSLLDAIRKTNVTDDEAGSITQHIGAYYVKTPKGGVVFLDTPGHEAFTAMRSRGASVTDIVVLVVAADDGVMPQTIEAINHSKVANVPIIVAVNKIDKPEAQPDRILRELTEAGLTPEEWGGDTIFVQVSAKQKKGIDTLLEMLLIQSEMMELKADPDKLAVGHVIEAKLDSGRGPVATVLVQEGTLQPHHSVVCGLHYGKIRALLDDRNRQIVMAGPSMPVEIIGLSGVPNAGDELIALADEKDARQISEHRIQKQRSKELTKTSRMSLENLFEQMQEGEVKELNLIIKADVNGSIEALESSLTKLSNNEVKINVVHSATGTISESDVSLAQVSDAIIIGFNVRPNTKVHALANKADVDMHFYNVIYDVIKEVQDAIVGMMSSTFKEHILGRAEVREIFHIPKIGAIAGTYVTDGKVLRNSLIRLLREGVVIYEGTISSLRRFKDDAKEVQSGYECGIGIENYNDIKLNDTLECYYLEEIKPKIG
jgi:translation initiation factor IF-2